MRMWHSILQEREDCRESNRIEGQVFCSGKVLELMSVYENHSDYQFGTMNDPIELLFLLHELESISQC